MAESTPGAGTARLALKIFLVALLAALLVAAAWAFVHFGTAAEPDRPAVEAVSRAWGAYAAEEGDRYARLGLAARVLAREPSLIEVMGGAGAAAATVGGEAANGSDALADLLAQRRDDLGYDFAFVLDGDGRVVAATDRPQMVGIDLSQRALVARGLEDGGATGVWSRADGRLAHAAVEWVAPDFELLGYVVVGRDLDDVLALQVQRTSGAEVAFLAPVANTTPGGVAGRVVGSSLDPRAAQRLAGELAGDEGLLADREPRDGAEVDLGGETGRGGGSYQALLAPLRDADGEPAGAVLVAAPLVGGTAATVLPWLAAAGAAALLVALLGAVLVARSALAPVGRLATLVSSAPQEGFARRPEPGRAGHLAPLAAALRRLFRDLQEERTLSATAAATAAAAEVPGATAAEKPRIGKTVLVAVDLRRYARLGADGGGVRDTADRLRRDEARVRSLVTAHSGRPAGGAGHRLLAAFDGDGAERRAVAAGAAVLAALGERDDAFDEGDPPAVAVASGRAASGGGGGARSPAGRFLIGPVVQLVESLLREASPGELVMSRPVARAVGDELAAAGTPADELRGLLSPQPLFVLRQDAAGRLAGDELAAARAGVATPPAPGDVVDGRYEVLALRGGSSAGPLFLARDRNLGREVALKRIGLAGTGEDLAGGRDGLLSAVRRFSHPGVAEVYALDDGGDPFADGGGDGDGGADDDDRSLAGSSFSVGGTGRAIYAREWVAGAPLDVGRDLPLPATLGLGRQLAAALAAVHGAGLVHGRVKPENVVLVPGFGARLTDLGVGALVGSAASAAAGEHLRPPEQSLGRLGDARADVYAWAALVARLATGRWWPGDGEVAAEGLPDGFTALLRRCLAADPDARPADGAEVSDALSGVTA